MAHMDEFVDTTGVGTVAAQPDAMRVAVAVEVAATAVADALSAVAEGARRAGEVARRHTDEANITSAGFRVANAHDHQGRAKGFSASHRLLILCDLTAAGQLVTELGEHVGDALRVNVVHPAVTDTGAPLHEARELALHDARTKAQQLAELAGRSLGPALQIREGTHGGDYLEHLAVSSSASVDFEPGGVDVTAMVSVRWALTD